MVESLIQPLLGLANITLISKSVNLRAKAGFRTIAVSAPEPVPAMEITSVKEERSPASVAIMAISTATFIPLEQEFPF